MQKLLLKDCILRSTLIRVSGRCSLLSHVYWFCFIMDPGSPTAYSLLSEMTLTEINDPFLQLAERHFGIRTL